MIELHNYSGTLYKVLLDGNVIINVEPGFNLPTLLHEFTPDRIEINKQNRKSVLYTLNNYVGEQVTVISTKKQDKYYAEIILKNDFSLNSLILLTINR